MARPELGTKYSCTSCETKFYDLNRTPVTCPKCGEVYSEAPARPIAPKKASPPAAAKPKKVPPANVQTSEPDDQEVKDDAEIDEELLADVEIDDEDTDENADDAVVFIEDDDDDSESVTGIVGGAKPDKEVL